MENDLSLLNFLLIINAGKGDVDAVSDFLKQGVDPNVMLKGSTLL
jgi:hypothetical protein